MMKMTASIQFFALLLCTCTLVHGLRLNNNNEARNGKNGKLVNTLDVSEVSSGDDGDDSGLFYSDGALSDEKDGDNQSTLLDTLLLDVIQGGGGNGSTEGDLSKCQQYKPQIAEICLAKFVQRTRYRPDWELPSPPPSADPAGGKKLSSTLASPQQICCELKLTYMRCLLTNLNFVCPLTEFNSEYERVKGLTEMCTRFFSKSSKKCRRRYRNKPTQVDSSTSSSTVSSVNSTA